jgi:hypothetical protein
MEQALTTYFEGEKTAGLMLAGIGVVGLVAAAVLYPARYDLRALSITVAACALVELAIGVGLFLKTPSQIARLEGELHTDTAAFYAAETPRMERVQRTFMILELTWIAFISGTAIVAVAFKQRPAIHGIALGLLVHLGSLLAFDLIADRRGAVYLEALRTNQRTSTGAQNAVALQ